MLIRQMTLMLLIALSMLFPVENTDASDGNTGPQTPRGIVEKYVAAFNACDVDAAAIWMHEDIEWLSINGSGVETVSSGKSSLVAESRAYMAEGCSTKSDLAGWSENGPFVSVIETATWSAKDGQPRSQSSTAIYEVTDLQIRRVWYFPEVK